MNFDATFLLTLPTRIYCGYSSVRLAGPEAKKNGIQKPLVVTDQGIRKAGVLEPLLNSLEESGLRYEIFDEVPMDPDTRVVAKGDGLLKETGCDGVIAFGGGSVLCAGKGIGLVATNGGKVRDYEGLEKYKKPPLPLLAIPTTAGSGSEVSSVFIISDEERNNYKMTIGGLHCFPNVAILDPLLLRKLPAFQFVISGVDALAHAIEAICTSLATPLTDAIAYEAIRLMMRQLVRAAYTDDLEAKRDQLLASAMANIACGNAKLGLVHASAQPLGSYHMAHGLAIGILLPYVMEFNLPACEEKMARMAEVIGAGKPQASLSEQARAAVDGVKRLLVKLDFPDRIPGDVVPKEDILKMAKITAGRPQMAFNLRKADERDLIKIYEQAYQGWRDDFIETHR